LDTSAGTLDARIGNLVVGTRTQDQSGTQVVPALKGIMTMSAGTLDTNTILVGNSSRNISTHGFLNVSGGQVIANTGTVTFGQTSSGVSTVAGVGEGTLNLSGGTFTAPAILLGNKQTAQGSAVGTINLSGGTLAVGTLSKGATGTANFAFTGGRLEAQAIGFSVVQQGGTFAVETGTTNITGNYDLQSAGTLEVSLASPLATALAVSGNITLAGELDILFDPETIVAHLGDSVDILTGSHISGEFSNASNGAHLNFKGLLFDISYSPTAVTLSNIALPAPEPASGSLLALGLLGLAHRRRQRQRA
jgi:hypothetical protein